MTTAQVQILIVEDEESIATGLRFNFEAEGYEAIVMADGPSALEYFGEHVGDVDVVILDLMLPGMSGYEICRAIREQDSQVPILVLSARTLSEDKSHAFDCGTDQYMTKPFALPELLARVRSLLIRSQQKEQPVSDVEELEDVTIGEATVSFRTYEIRREDDVQTLTTMELQLLKYFIKNEGDVLSRAQILKDVWDQGTEVTTRTIDNFVMRLRRYLENDPANPKYLLSVRGTGYRFVGARDDAE